MRPTSILISAALLLLSTAAVARPAQGEGVVVRLEPGYALWSLDGQHIQSQPQVPPGEVQPLLVDQTQNAFATTLVLGYNIKGHVGIEASLTGTGWDLSSQARGGAGFAALCLNWSPAQLFGNQPAIRDRNWDASFFFGAGYGTVGEQRALDGLHLQLGGRLEYFPTHWFSVGAAVRYIPLLFNRYVLDWNNNVAVPLQQGSGGSVLIPALTLTVHAPLGV